jgi:hypothetical protein
LTGARLERRVLSVQGKYEAKPKGSARSRRGAASKLEGGGVAEGLGWLELREAVEASEVKGLRFKVYGAEAEVRGTQGGVAVERRLKPREARG